MEKREIKFRAWEFDNNGGKLVYGYESYIGEALQNGYHLMQFTGLHDKNGKEIFEGDILNVDCLGVGGAFDDGVYKVEYIIPDCAFALIQIDGKHGIPFNECYEYEAIGNIYETNLIA
jgi:uncharacterized phage protein (TIGR01671 family)